MTKIQLAVEAVHRIPGAILFSDPIAQLACFLNGRRFQAEVNGIRKPICSKPFVRNRRRSRLI
jgi:hypothetical protein